MDRNESGSWGPLGKAARASLGRSRTSVAGCGPGRTSIAAAHAALSGGDLETAQGTGPRFLGDPCLRARSRTPAETERARPTQRVGGAFRFRDGVGFRNSYDFHAQSRTLPGSLCTLSQTASPPPMQHSRPDCRFRVRQQCPAMKPQTLHPLKLTHPSVIATPFASVAASRFLPCRISS